MAKKYGPHGETVARFLDEVRSTDKDMWRAYVERAAPTDAAVDATVALTEVPLAAPVRTAVHSAALAAFRSLGLSADDLPAGVYASAVSGGIKSAAMALAAGDLLDPEHRRALLGPFLESGFTSVVDSVPSRPGS